MKPHWTPLLLLLCLIGCTGEPIPREYEPEERTLTYNGEVQFLDESGEILSTLRVSIADDAESRQAGLMNVDSLPEDHGMLFLFEREEPLSFWMANTPLSLDIIFADAAGTIVRIHTHTQPYSNESLTSGVPARYAVEVVGGYTMDHDIREGGRIQLERD